jgi:hypothetical protein
MVDARHLVIFAVRIAARRNARGSPAGSGFPCGACPLSPPAPLRHLPRHLRVLFFRIGIGGMAVGRPKQTDHKDQREEKNQPNRVRRMNHSVPLLRENAAPSPSVAWLRRTQIHLNAERRRPKRRTPNGERCSCSVVLRHYAKVLVIGIRRVTVRCPRNANRKNDQENQNRARYRDEFGHDRFSRLHSARNCSLRRRIPLARRSPK